MRVAAGARWALQQGFQLEASAVIALSARPSLRPEAAWVPIEPRALLLLGVSYTWSLVEKSAPVLDTTNPYHSTGAAEPAPPPDKQIATVQGQIVDEHGQPIPDVRVTLKTADGTQTELLTDAYGSYHFEGVPYGTVQLEARAVGFATQHWDATVNSPQVDAPEAKALPPATHVGVLRGLIRSFRSTPLTAHVTITGAHGKVVEERDTTPDGRIELELPPGKYKVTIEARGYVRQTQSIRIHGNGVSVLNTDMRAQ
jgi:5-hydroxyisourate hydrolase-like protein (transthyretin family)